MRRILWAFIVVSPLIPLAHDPNFTANAGPAISHVAFQAVAKVTDFARLVLT